MYITQGSGGSFSHKGTMANDVRGAEPGVRYAYYSPCDVKLIWRDINNGQGMWQSLEKVRFANGNIDYATFVTCHDNTFDAQIGQVVRQGEQLGNMGDKGNATGVHCHIEIAQHKYDISNWRKNQYGIYCFPNETDTDDCYFVNDTNILEGMGGNWRMIPEESHKIGYKVHIENVGWQDWKFDGETAGTTGQSKRMEALRIDYDKDVYKNKLVNPFKNYRKEQINNNKMASLSFRSMNNPFKKYSNSYISNINDYCIQEGDKNLFPEKSNNKLYPIVQKNYINNEQIRRLYNIEKKINYKESPFYLAYNERNNNGGFKRRGEDISSYEKIRQNKDYFGNKKNSLDKNEYRDMKNFNSHNFHKKHLSSSDN